MNTANETLRAIKNRKAFLTKEKDEAINYINECYQRDIKILEKEEKQLLKQFKDIPEDTQWKEHS